MSTPVDPSRLVTVGTFASTYKAGLPVNRSYIYKLIKQGKLETVEIDRILFVVLPEKPGQVG